jgi:hypothetical protein
MILRHCEEGFPWPCPAIPQRGAAARCRTALKGVARRAGSGIAGQGRVRRHWHRAGEQSPLKWTILLDQILLFNVRLLLPFGARNDIV